MSGINLDTPTLSYVGAVDISSSNGYTSYNILFDSTVATLASVLMFEYKFQSSTVSNPTPQDISLNYINTENAIQSGMANQWLITIPALDNIYDPSPSLTVQVRVYAGVLNSADIVVTEWSNPLDVHNPPTEPTFVLDSSESVVFYDIGNNQPDDLFVFLNIDEDISYNIVKFTVTYYYTDPSGFTQWGISEPLLSTLSSINRIPCRLVTVPNFGKVSSVPIYQFVYTSVYAVYEYLDGSNNYYSVSHVSDTAAAKPSTAFDSPVLTNIDYLVYVDRSQIMNVEWTAPIISSIPIYTVDYYIVEYSTNGNTWNVAPGGGHVTGLSYPFDCSSYDCGSTLFFRVIAVNTNGGISLPSDDKSKNIFYYATAPLNSKVDWAVTDISNNYMDLLFTFNNVADTGCNDGIVHYVVEVYDNSLPDPSIIATKDVDYVAGPARLYYVNFNEIQYSESGIVKVYLVTKDTNSSFGDRDGAPATDSYTTDQVPIYVNVDVSGNALITFDIITRNPLAPFAGVVYPNGGLLDYVNWFTNIDSQTGVTISRDDPSSVNNFVYIYHVTMTPYVVGLSTFPSPFGIVSANTAGIGEVGLLIP
jgi:hypothetical protein